MVDVSGRSKHLHKKVLKRARIYLKDAYHFLQNANAENRTLLFIVGCQRSGTTLLQHIFEQDWNTKVFAETGSSVTRPSEGYQLRLKSLPQVQEEIDKTKAPFVILKPLVESQNSLELLDYFDGSKAIWIYRHFNDVIASKVKKFGLDSGIGDLQFIADGDESDWRMEKLPETVKNIVLKYFDKNMDPYIAAALFWYIRNQFVLELDLFNNRDVYILRYEDLVSDPKSYIQEIYQFLGRNFPGEDILGSVHSTSIGKGKGVNLPPDIYELCSELQSRIDHAYQTKRSKIVRE